MSAHRVDDFGKAKWWDLHNLWPNRRFESWSQHTAGIQTRNGATESRVSMVTFEQQSVGWTWLTCLILFPLVGGCVSTINWVHDPPGPSSCLPDRPPTWDDFLKRSDNGKEAALTVVQFYVIRGQPARLQVQLDNERSWVKPEFVKSWNPWFWSQSGQVLRHEQLHFAISCLLTRQANAALKTGGDPQAMLLLLTAVSARMNVQYDAETNHGLDRANQAVWEQSVQSRLKAGTLE